ADQHVDGFIGRPKVDPTLRVLMLRQQRKVEPATNFVDTGNILANVGANERLDELRDDWLKLVISQIGSKPLRFDQENAIQSIPGDAGIKTHSVDHSIDRREP